MSTRDEIDAYCDCFAEELARAKEERLKSILKEYGIIITLLTENTGNGIYTYVTIQKDGVVMCEKRKL